MAQGLSADVCMSSALIPPDRSENSLISRISLISRAEMTAWWCHLIWWCHSIEIGTEGMQLSMNTKWENPQANSF